MPLQATLPPQEEQVASLVRPAETPWEATTTHAERGLAQAARQAVAPSPQELALQEVVKPQLAERDAKSVPQGA
jgi:hypothetical protein